MQAARQGSAAGASTTGREHHDYFVNYAATTIQKHWRGHRVRKRYLATVRAVCTWSRPPHAMLAAPDHPFAPFRHLA